MTSSSHPSVVLEIAKVSTVLNWKAIEMSHKPYMVGGLLFTAAAVAITAVYLPNYTEKSYKHSENVPNSTNLMGGATNEKGSVGGGSRGSMWGNIEKERIKEESKQSSTKTGTGA